MRKIFNILCFLFLVNLIFAQKNDTILHVETVTVEVNKLFKKSDAGMKKSVVDSTILASKINNSLSELLAENTPIFIKSYGRGSLTTASFRGTANSHTAVIWNGLSINNPMSGMVDFSLIPMYVIDDVNLQYGAASLSGQSGGIGGAVNIGNVADWSNKKSFKYLKSYGSFASFDDFLALNFGNDKLQIKTRIYKIISENNFTFINRSIGNIDTLTGKITNPLDTNKNANYEKYGLLQEVYYRLNNSNIVSVKYWGQFAGRAIPNAVSFEGFDDASFSNQLDEDNKFVADWQCFWGGSKLILKSGYSQKKVKYTSENMVAGLGNIPSIYSQSKQKTYLNALQYRYDFSKNLTVEAKFDYVCQNVISRDSVSKTGYDKVEQKMSFFGAIRKNFYNRLNLNFTLRKDNLNGNFLPVTPYFGFDFRLLKNANFILKGNVARNYHSPSLNDLYWQPGGNINLLAEKGVGGELGLEFQKIILHSLLNIEATTYYSDIDNWIIWLPSFKGYWSPFNIKKVISKGLEVAFSLKGEVKNMRYVINANYAYTSSVNHGEPLNWGDNSCGKQLVYIPLHSGNLFVDLEYKGFFVSWQHNSYSERFTTSSNDITRRDWLYPYFMNDIALGKKININNFKISLKLKVYNVFDEVYHSVLYRQMPGRNYTFVASISI